MKCYMCNEEDDMVMAPPELRVRLPTRQAVELFGRLSYRGYYMVDWDNDGAPRND